MTEPTARATHSIADFRRGYEEEKRLRGFRSGCGFVSATWVLVCPRCGERDLSDVELSGTGRISSFTVQNVPGDEFLNEAPYAYVVVDLDGGGRITGWINGIRDEADLSIGDEVRWTETYKPGVHFERVTRPEIARPTAPQ